MKIFSFILLLLAPVLYVSDPIVEWLTPVEHDFGDLVKDRPVEHFFKFKNISGEPFAIDNVRTTCGCTAPDWSLLPVAAGDTSQLRIEFNAAKPGYFRKKIKVYFNSQRKAEILYIEGFVLGE